MDREKCKSYKAQFDDRVEFRELNTEVTSSMRSRHKFESYVQVKPSHKIILNDENDNLLLFWKVHEKGLPNLSKLIKRIFCVSASSAAVERDFSSGGVIISQQRTSSIPSTVDDINLIRSFANRSRTSIWI